MSERRNPYEESARTTKALKLAAVLRKAMRTGKLSLTDMRTAANDPEFRRVAEEYAEVNKSSDDTWKLVISMLEQDEEALKAS